MSKQSSSKLMTIIIPCYNIEPYIDACLHSVMSQNIIDKCQVICINDGCTDKTPNIIQKYVKKFPNTVQMLEQYNKMGVANWGVSNARNMGLNIARGETVMFVDGDDLIGKSVKLDNLIAGCKMPTKTTDKYYLESCYDTLMGNPESAMVVSGITFLTSDGETAFATKPQRTLLTELFSGKLDTVEKQLDFLNRRMTSCAALYRTDIIQQYDIHFNPRFAYFEDTDFIMKYALSANEEYPCIFTPVKNSSKDAMYLYRRRQHSAMMKLSLHSERDSRRLDRTKNKLIFYAQLLDKCHKKYGASSFIYNKCAHRYVQTEKDMQEYAKNANDVEYDMLSKSFIPYGCMGCNNHNCGTCTEHKKLMSAYHRCLRKTRDKQK